MQRMKTMNRLPVLKNYALYAIEIGCRVAAPIENDEQLRGKWCTNTLEVNFSRFLDFCIAILF